MQAFYTSRQKNMVLSTEHSACRDSAALWGKKGKCVGKLTKSIKSKYTQTGKFQELEDFRIRSEAS